MNMEHLMNQLFGRRESAFEAQIRELRREVRRVGQSVSRHAGDTAHAVSRQANHTAHDWSDSLADFGQEAAKRGAQFAEIAAYQAGRGAKAVRNDPLPVIAILGTALLAVSLLNRR